MATISHYNRDARGGSQNAYQGTSRGTESRTGSSMRGQGSGTSSTSRRGFAAMDPERQREIASMGGRASGGNFANDPARAAEVGRRGGEHSHAGRSRHGE
jgi:general stress protein YciG